MKTIRIHAYALLSNFDVIVAVVATIMEDASSRIFIGELTSEQLRQLTAHADGTRTTLPHSQSTIVLYTRLDVECDQQSAIGRRL